MKKSTKKGFTLVELVIVIAVIAILSAILIPTFGNVISNANETKYRSGAKAGYEEMLVDQMSDHPEVGSKKALVIYFEGTKVVRAYDAANGEMVDVTNNGTYGSLNVTLSGKTPAIKVADATIALTLTSGAEFSTVTEGEVGNNIVYKVNDNVSVIFYA